METKLKHLIIDLEELLEQSSYIYPEDKLEKAIELLREIVRIE